MKMMKKKRKTRMNKGKDFRHPGVVYSRLVGRKGP
jgi:hypothetical protein